MKKIRLKVADKTTDVLIGEHIAGFREHVPDNTCVITDENVNRLYGMFWDDLPAIVLEAGELQKTLSTVEKICTRLLNYGLDRSGFIVGIGGGIVCDIAGFTASIFMRGIPFGFVPTTLLAQADAAMGGKNGVNLHGYKNIIGSFSQPEFIFSDPNVLTTLPEAEIANGFAEMVKHALIADDAMFEFMERHVDDMKQLHPEVIGHLLSRSVEIKAEIVSRDVYESGERRLLNFGHTFGHAIEKVSGISHGAAVSLGMMIAGRYSVSGNYLKAYDLERMENLLRGLDLPVRMSMPEEKIYEAVLADKKRIRTHIHFVALEAIGTAFIEVLPVTQLKQMKIH